jgi:nucleoside-diphosphate-sugar epimerase
VHRYVPEVSRARKELGLEVSVPLEVAVQRTLQWNLS